MPSRLQPPSTVLPSSLISPHPAPVSRDTVGRGTDVSQGFTFKEVNSARASTSKAVCCDFSSDGKLLATGGHDKKPGYSLHTFMGHSAPVMSLDFHPNKDDLICSCDWDGEIRYWSINNGGCAKVFKGGTGHTAQMRFQPHVGKYLAAAAEKGVSILDVETQICRLSLQGHTKPIHSVCWDPSGEYLASVSEDSVRVWTVGSGSEGECVHELNCNGNKFHSCVFYPNHPSLLVMGCYQSLELWNMSDNMTMTLPAHDGLIAALAVSTVTGLVASVSHDKFVKLWK